MTAFQTSQHLATSKNGNLQHVVEEMLSLYEGLLGLRFEPDAQLTKEAWAPGVKGYRVR
jgi:Zn-dependent oligopeptidase